MQLPYLEPASNLHAYPRHRFLTESRPTPAHLVILGLASLGSACSRLWPPLLLRAVVLPRLVLSNRILRGAFGAIRRWNSGFDVRTGGVLVPQVEGQFLQSRAMRHGLQDRVGHAVLVVAKPRDRSVWNLLSPSLGGRWM